MPLIGEHNESNINAKKLADQPVYIAAHVVRQLNTSWDLDHVDDLMTQTINVRCHMCSITGVVPSTINDVEA